MASEKNNIKNRERGTIPTGKGQAAGDNNYTFMKEKIVPKRKRKVKRFAAAFFGTLFLAVVFGIVAQAAFIYSEPWVEKLLGKEKENQRQQVILPTGEPTTGNTVQNGTNTGTNSTTGNFGVNSQGQSGTTGEQPTTNEQGTTEAEVGSTGGQQGDNSGGGGKTDTTDPSGSGSQGDGEETTEPDTVIVEQRIEADLTDYIGIYSDIRVLAAKMNDSLLEITAVTNGVDWFNDLYEETRTTTGLVIADDGTDLLLLTSLDRIEDADKIEVEVSFTTSVQGYIRDYDRDVNLAVVGVPLSEIPSAILKSLTPAEFGTSSATAPGTPIIAVGSPNGHVGSVEVGIITSRGSSVYVVDNRIDLFNTNITDNEASDGFIVNLQGQVIGIITHTLKEDLNENLSTAIGISKIMPLIQRMANKVDRIYFGIHGEEVPKDILENVGVTSGIYVNEVESGSPALEAGVKSGDIIVKVKDAPISSMTAFYNVISNYSAGDTIEITVYRQSQGTFKEVSLQAVLKKKEG
ncbi:MAG: serine protease [Lachnospiraceae bacterium]|nr:serine protease [Lachnospiraceae bacterium]